VFQPMRTDRAGMTGPTPRAARRAAYRRTSRGLYLPADVDGTRPEQRIVEAAAVLPSYGGVTGWAGLRWAGGHWFGGVTAHGELLPVVLATGYDDILNQPGVVISQERLNRRDLAVHDGMRITSPVRSLVFEMRYATGVRSAVEAAGMAAYDDLASAAEVIAYCARHSGWIGIPQARKAAMLMVENSWSPMECRVRLVWQLDADLPPLLCNPPVFDRFGRHLATPDLLDVEAGLAIDYDGALHLEGARRRRDIEREDLLRAHGIETMTVVSGALSAREALVMRMLAARRRAHFEAESTRRWTTDPPSWWIPTHTVDLRRSLAAQDRARVLRYRRAG
jgi:hypothetical protein